MYLPDSCPDNLTSLEMKREHQKMCRDQINKMKIGILTKKQKVIPKEETCPVYTTAPYDKAELKFWHYFHNFDKPNVIKYHRKMRESRVDLMEHYDATKNVYYQRSIYDDETGEYIGMKEAIMTEQIYKEVYEGYMEYINMIERMIKIVPERYWIKK
jgi:hypothetical protein